ncbi:MAG: efflux RND transporter periplasmic adaptor subunit [Marinobacter sp.]|jgi:RND family efflux transporter MFP subunit
MIRLQTLIMTALLITTLAACDSSTTAEPKAPAKAAVSVRTAEITSGPIQAWVFAEGTARAIEREFLSFESAGRIAYVDPELKEGDPISEGQVIAYQQQDRPEADLANARASVVEAQGQKAIAEASLEEAEANLEVASNTYQRFQALMDQQSASQQELEDARAKLEQARAAKTRAQRQLTAASSQIEAARAQADLARVTAAESRIVSPIDGVLARLNIEQGYYFSPQQIQSNSEAGALNTVPVVIIDPSAFEITVKLPSYAHRQVTIGADVLLQPGVGQDVAGRPDSQGTETPSRAPMDFPVRGEVYAISPSVDPDTRIFAVKLRTTEGADRLQDGEFLTAWIAGPRIEDDPIIPMGVTRFENDQAYVFRLDPAKNEVSRVNIKLGLRGRNHQQVLKGLAVGDQIVVEGHARLSDGDSVRIINNDNQRADRS